MFNDKIFILNEAESQLASITEKWCENYANGSTGGEMREARGKDIESFVRDTINNIGKLHNINLVAKKGDEDNKKLSAIVEEREIVKENHQVDVHIYLNQVFIAVIECKAYLDSCYYVRACDDFSLFHKFNYPVKSYIFALENSIKEDTRLFTNYVTDNVCDEIFYMLDGKRSSSKPIYDARFKKNINTQSLSRFIDVIFDLAGIQE
jgi:hypothetical protein